MIPGLYDGHDKAFFFFHYEQIRFPNSFTRTRTVYNPRVFDGMFRYQFGSEVREVNLLHAGGRQRADRREGPDDDEPVRPDRRRDEDDWHPRSRWRPALRQLRVAEPLRAVRASADHAGGLQPAGQPVERIVLVDHGQADARLSEQRRPALSRRAESARLRLEAAAAVAGDAIGPVEEPRSTSCAAG